MNRTWVVSEQYAPEQNTTSYYLTRLAEGLAESRPVSVLCGQPNYLSRGLRAPKREILHGVSVHRCSGTKLDKNVFPFKIANMLTLGLSVFFRALFSFKRGDTVLVVTSPPVMPFLAAIAAFFRRPRFVLLVFDRYPQNLVATGLAKPGGLAERFLNRCNAWLYSRSDLIIAVGRDMANAIASHPGARPEKVRTIQNWAMLEDVSPEPRDQSPLLEELGLREKFVVLYAGNMGPPQDIESVAEAAELLDTDEHPDIHFLFIGTGRKRPWLEERVRGLGNVTVLDPRPLSEQNSFLNACDVAVVPLVAGMKTAAMPSRTYNFFAAGKPIIAGTEVGSELAIVVEEDDAGWVIPPHDAAAVANAVTEARKAGRRLEQMSRNALRSARTKYSFETALGKYLEVIPAAAAGKSVRKGADDA